MSRYFHVVEAEQVEISDAGVLPQGMQWVRDRWVYVTPYGMLWPRSGDWIVTDQNGRGVVLRDEEFQRVYAPCPADAAGRSRNPSQTPRSAVRGHRHQAVGGAARLIA